jgi:hypothetical protein
MTFLREAQENAIFLIFCRLVFNEMLNFSNISASAASGKKSVLDIWNRKKSVLDIWNSILPSG